MGDWKENTALSDDTAVVKIYTNIQHKEKCKERAEAHNRSLSRHLFVIIQEARFLQQEGQLTFTDPPRDPDGRTEVDTQTLTDLKEEVDELSSLLREEQASISSEDGSELNLDVEWVRNVLDGEGRDLDELLERLLEQSELRSWLKRPI